MTDLDIIIIIGGSAFIISAIGAVLNTKLLTENRQLRARLWSRMHYIEMAMSYHNIIPLPWEEEDLLEDKKEPAKRYKQEGNIVFLEKGED